MARTKLGPLALEARLGDAHSHVWRAVHMAQRKNLVVKIFSTPFKPTTAAKQELAHEWETLKSVRSEAIARCFGGGFEENDAYLAYEWLDGETWNNWWYDEKDYHGTSFSIMPTNLPKASMRPMIVKCFMEPSNLTN